MTLLVWTNEMRASIAAVILLFAGPSSANDVAVKEGDTLILNRVEYRLQGIDAPEMDQVCLDQNATLWPCGIEARDRLAGQIGGRAVRCDDVGPDWIYRRRRVGICWAEGETVSLNQWLVREGWALNFEPYAKGRFRVEQTEARKEGRGLWKGCFSAPRDLRRWRKQRSALLGSNCGRGNLTLNRLFSNRPVKPPGCSIKGRIIPFARITGYRGIYHIETCPSYARARPNRWFCSEAEARTQGFRRSC
jgi:endonuclease YncB( thermonuclease family)